MSKLFDDINRVLAEWDPIGVGKNLANDEYKTYIPLLLQYIGNREQLLNCLQDILVNKLGIDYDPANKIHLKDLQQICNKIIWVSKLIK